MTLAATQVAPPDAACEAQSRSALPPTPAMPSFSSSSTIPTLPPSSPLSSSTQSRKAAHRRSSPFPRKHLDSLISPTSPSPPPPSHRSNHAHSKEPPAASASASAASAASATSAAPRTARDPSISPVHAPPSLFDFIVGLDAPHQSDQPLEEALNVASKRRGVYNLIQVPLRLERLLFFGQLLCVHDFLATFTFLPLRLVRAVLRILLALAMAPLRFFLRTFFRRFRRAPRTDAQQAAVVRSRVQITVDLLNASLLVATVFVLRAFDTSRIYHNIRGQSVIKLYVVFNVIEIFDRLCSSFGVDMLDSLGWTAASAVSFFSRRPAPDSSVSSTDSSVSSTAANMAGRALQGLVLLTRVAFDYSFTLIYLIVHAVLLLTWIVTLNVAINTQNNALLTLLISNNFVELKGSVFKNYKVPNVFQIACADAVERFQLTVFLLVMIVVTGGDPRLYTTWAIIYACELVVDWIKHAFVSKFNRISHRVYHMFGLVICDDMVRTRSHTAVRAIGGSAVSKRIGFVSLPLAAVVVRMTSERARQLPILALGLMWLLLVIVRSALSIALTGHAWRRVRSGPPEDTGDEERERDEYWFQKLAQVERYDLISKG